MAMAESKRKRKGELVRGVFRILLDHPDGLRAKEVLLRLEDEVPPNDFENSTYPNRPNLRRYEKIVRFNTITAVKAGWMVKNKGVWSVTDEGQRAFERYTDPTQFSLEANRLYGQWKAGQIPDESEQDAEDSDSAIATLEEAEEAAWSDIESYLGEMSPYDFQEVVAGLLRGMGYFVEWISPPGPDKGIDIVAHVDPLGLKGPRIKAQVKRRADKANVDSVRGFMALLGDTDVGLFVCTGGFTRDAEEEARRQEKRRIMLLDLKRLFDLWTDHYNEIPEEQRRLLPLQPVYYLAPDD